MKSVKIIDSPLVSNRRFFSNLDADSLSFDLIQLFSHLNELGPPCRGFTPRLIEAYNTAKAAGVDLEIIFVSSDHDETSFKSYYSSMPWSAISFDPQMSQELRSTFGVNGIPALVVISKDGKLITKDGRGEVARTGSKAFQNWSVYNGPGETLEESSFGCNIC